jgi:hypothetical protein
MSVSEENKIHLQNPFGHIFAIPRIRTNGRADKQNQQAVLPRKEKEKCMAGRYEILATGKGSVLRRLLNAAEKPFP